MSAFCVSSSAASVIAAFDTALSPMPRSVATRYDTSAGADTAQPPAERGRSDAPLHGEDGESISYAVDGVEYVIDMKDEHATEVRETFEYYIAHSTRSGAADTARTGRPPRLLRGGRRAGRRRSGLGRSSRATSCLRAAVSPPRSSKPSTTPTDRLA